MTKSMNIVKSYPVPAVEKKVELEVKRSKFIAFVGNASTRLQAEAFVKNLRAEHPHANHVCWAYIVGSPDSTVRSMSDDREPNGTAGMPMLKVLEHSGLGDVVVAVVRYFGGTKLGTGGLQRAYSDAVATVLEGLPVALKVSRVTLKLMYDYSFQGAISRLFDRYDVACLDTQYATQVITNLAVAAAEVAAMKSELANITGGSISIQNREHQ